MIENIVVVAMIVIVVVAVALTMRWEHKSVSDNVTKETTKNNSVNK